jgi:protein O-mannosyl-transferase
MSHKPDNRASGPQGAGSREGKARPRRGARATLASQEVWVGVLLLASALLAYAPVLHGGLIWDDDQHVTRPELWGLRGLWRIWFEPGATQQYYPLLHSAFWVEHRLWADSTLGYHVANVALHAAASWLLYRLLRRLALPGALFAAFAFALHPVCVESVAWISEQKNTLSAVFYLAAALCYLRFDRDRRSGAYIVGTVLFGMALATKSVTATLPAALLVMLWWKRGRLSLKGDVLPLVPWLGMGAIAGFVTAWIERAYIGAKGAAFEFGVADRFLVAGRAVWFYLGKLFWPSNLAFIYPRWTLDPTAPWQYLFPAAVAVVLALLFVVRGRARGPLASALLFIGTLFPALGFINVYPFIYSFVADHFQYLAAAAVIAATAAGLTLAAARLPRAGRMAAAAAGACAVAGLGLLTSRQCSAYVDATTLWNTTIARNPEGWMAYENLGGILLAEGRPDQAAAQFETALRIKGIGDPAEAHYNLGCALAKLPGRLDEAVAEFGESLRLNPGNAEAHYNLARALELMPGRMDDAVLQYREAVRLKPGYAEAHVGLGSALQSSPGHLNELIAENREALRLDPGLALAHFNLGFALEKIPGSPAEVISQYEDAIRLEPDYAEAHYNLGCVLQTMPGRVNDAITQFQDVVRLRPDNAAARCNLGNSLNLLGRAPEAIAQYEAALRLRPDDPAIHVNFAIILLGAPGHAGEAAAHLDEALRLEPGNLTARRILDRIHSVK